MNRTQMLERLKNGEDPLELSIQKWQDIVDGTGIDDMSNNCALCEVMAQIESGNECDPCPVCRFTTQAQCDGTPYIEYRACPSKENAQAEVDFLKSLRKSFILGDTK